MQMMPDADPEAVRNELFGMAGYKGGARFFKKQDATPKDLQMQQQMQQMQDMIQKLSQELQATQMELKNKAEETQVKAFDAQTKRMSLMMPEQQERTDPLAMIKADMASRLADADIDLKQAQTIKTIVEAMLAPSQKMIQQAVNVE